MSNFDRDQNLKRHKVLEKRTLLEEYPWSDVYVWSYIETGYRRPISSCTECLHSLFYLHNEWVNAWSHILGSAWVIFLMCHTIYFAEDFMSLSVIMIFLLASFYMCSFSATYHIFCCHSDNMCKTVQCFDWLGISFLVFSSSLLVSYFELQDLEYSNKKRIGFNIVNFILMILTYMFTYSNIMNSYDDLNKDQVLVKYIIRTLLNILYGLSPLILWTWRTVEENKQANSIWGMLEVYGCFVTVFLNIFHIPERFFPRGSLDILVSMCMFA